MQRCKNDDIVIKLTGRYTLLNLEFIHLVKKYSNMYDAFVKFFNVCTLQYLIDDCVLGMFAIKCKHLNNYNYNYNCVKSPECEFADYVRNNIFNIIEI